MGVGPSPAETCITAGQGPSPTTSQGAEPVRHLRKPPESHAQPRSQGIPYPHLPPEGVSNLRSLHLAGRCHQGTRHHPDTRTPGTRHRPAGSMVTDLLIREFPQVAGPGNGSDLRKRASSQVTGLSSGKPLTRGNVRFRRSGYPAAPPAFHDQHDIVNMVHYRLSSPCG